MIGHELGHGVTEHEAGLEYWGQSGALNERCSDVCGAMVKQYKLGQDAASADWLIGSEVWTPTIAGDALRSMKAPGEAYDDPLVGKDPQPAHMDDYVESVQDNGGVHINSGIPNKAFYLAATKIGGRDVGGHRPHLVRDPAAPVAANRLRLRRLRPPHGAHGPAPARPRQHRDDRGGGRLGGRGRPDRAGWAARLPRPGAGRCALS